MPRAVDTFIGLNERGYRWFGELDPIRDGKMGSVRSMSMDECSDLYGGDETDEPIERSYTPPSSAWMTIVDRYIVSKSMRENQIKVNVVSECGCVGVQKILHHPDKDDPFTVMRVCRQCHSKEHKQTRSDERLLLVSLLAVKILIERGNRKTQ